MEAIGHTPPAKVWKDLDTTITGMNDKSTYRLPEWLSYKGT